MEKNPTYKLQWLNNNSKKLNNKPTSLTTYISPWPIFWPLHEQGQGMLSWNNKMPHCWSSGEYTVWSSPRFETNSESLSYSNPWARPCEKRGKRWATKSFLDLPFLTTCKNPMTSWDPLPIDERKSVWKRASTPFPLSPPLVFGTTWYWGDWKACHGWAQGDSERIILYMAGRVQWWSRPTQTRFLCQERTIHALFLLPPVLHSGQCAPLKRMHHAI
jgi:hypothetical protein